MTAPGAARRAGCRTRRARRGWSGRSPARPRRRSPRAARRRPCRRGRRSSRRPARRAARAGRAGRRRRARCDAEREHGCVAVPQRVSVTRRHPSQPCRLAGCAADGAKIAAFTATERSGCVRRELEPEGRADRGLLPLVLVIGIAACRRWLRGRQRQTAFPPKPSSGSNRAPKKPSRASKRPKKK